MVFPRFLVCETTSYGAQLYFLMLPDFVVNKIKDILGIMDKKFVLNT